MSKIQGKVPNSGSYISRKLKTIREIILWASKKHNIRVHRAILFGSRARGDYREDSDWDILIVIEEGETRERLDDFWLSLKRKLVEHGIIPEIIIVDAKSYYDHKELRGYVYYWAEKEGITII